jgi:hypothetical protein
MRAISSSVSSGYSRPADLSLPRLSYPRDVATPGMSPPGGRIAPRYRYGRPESKKERPMTEHPHDIEITRVLDAPTERVYQAFTDPDQFARWYGPVGFPVHRDTVEVDARVGGRQRFEMVSLGIVAGLNLMT